MTVTPRSRDEQSLDALNGLEPTADRAVQNAVVQRHLDDRHFRVVAKAARLAEERALHERVPDLLQAYARFTVKPVTRSQMHCEAGDRTRIGRSRLPEP